MQFSRQNSVTMWLKKPATRNTLLALPYLAGASFFARNLIWPYMEQVWTFLTNPFNKVLGGADKTIVLAQAGKNN